MIWFFYPARNGGRFDINQGQIPLIVDRYLNQCWHTKRASDSQTSTVVTISLNVWYLNGKNRDRSFRLLPKVEVDHNFGRKFWNYDGWRVVSCTNCLKVRLNGLGRYKQQSIRHVRLLSTMERQGLYWKNRIIYPYFSSGNEISNIDSSPWRLEKWL